MARPWRNPTILSPAASYHSNAPPVRARNPSAEAARPVPASQPNLMRSHIIRLRGGWFWGDGPERTALPLTWPAEVARRVRLVRPFQAPPLDPGHVSLGIQLDDVPGLTVVELNGRELARPDPGTASLWLPLAPGTLLPRRNVLVLEVEPPRPAGCLLPDQSPWGAVALVIGTGGSGGSDGP